ncbi:SH3 and PX domain-containing protein 2B-like isoform X1 [Rhopilema esculentum]|uniref:SH3 and PX domain-containing protein 2B-like isoform X1 n=1 Tax=Rhopilema esculentum TaxID=499914 RepID=UPI0031CEB350
MVDTKSIENIKVVGLQKKKDHGSSKHYEFILRVKWSNKSEITIYRPYSMFFDFQGVLCEMFKEKYSITIPPVPATKFHWMLLGKLGIEKECRAIEDFCQKIISLPQLVSQSIVVMHFFDCWGTDVRASTQQSSDVIGSQGFGSPAIQETSNQTQDSFGPGSSPDQEHQYRAVASFTATNPGEISFEEGSVLTVAEKTDRGWWFVWNDLDQQGWAPATYLESFGAVTEEENDEWVEMNDSDMHAHLYSTVVAYTAQNVDEVSYSVGEEVEVLAKSNYGWWKIRYKDKIGLTPATNLMRKGEEYTSPVNTGRAMSISSSSGLYAVVRKAPPRKDSVRRSGNFSKKDPTRFVYSSASFSGGKFNFDDNTNSTFQDQGVKGSNQGQSDQVLQRGQSNEPAQSYENIGKKWNNGNASVEERRKAVKIEGVEIYSAIADYTPEKAVPDNLALHKGDIMQLISVEEGWFLVQLYRGSDVMEGWVPSTYVERRWDVDLDKMNISKPSTVESSPKPKPRPRPKPRDRAEEHLLTAAPPVPTPRKSSKPFINEADSVAIQGTEKAQDRPRLPLPQGKGLEQETSAGLSTPPVPCSGQEQEDNMESIYDEPEAQLRSVYDAEPWFFGKISRQECEQMLKQNGRQQEFMVRESTRGSGSYALSVKYCYRIRHFPIETTTGGNLLIGKLTFQNLIDVVSYYKENPLFYSEHKEPITLGNAFKLPS